MIVVRYVVGEIARPFLVICMVLIVIFACFSSARYLSDAAAGLLPARTVSYFIALKLAITMATLLPIALYLSVVVGLGRLYSDLEMTALAASGISNARILWTVLCLSLVVASIVACLSLFVRPWAYHKSYWLEARAEAELEASGLEPRRFYEGMHGARLFFADRIDPEEGRLERVFMQREIDAHTQIVRAAEARQTKAQGQDVWLLRDGHIYELDRTGADDRISTFETMTILVEAPEVAPPDKRKSTSTARLAASDSSKDLAELQGRFSTPLATLLLGMLGVPMSRSAPRRGRYARTLAAVLTYAVYYNVRGLAKTLVEQGTVGPIPGLWWADALLGVVLVVLLVGPGWAFKRRARTASVVSR